MAEKKNKRVFAGYYERYDLVNIHVAMVVDDVDSGEKIVLFTYEGKHDDGKNHAISLKSFCEEVEYHGNVCPKFKRKTQRYKNKYYEEELSDAGLKVPRRHVKKEKPCYTIRTCRRCSSYEEYAKDMCVHYSEDLNRYNQTVKMKRYVGVMGKSEFDALKEDLTFLQDCFYTSLKQYLPMFKMIYIKGVSIRNCAEELGKNRGSIEYAKKKMLDELADLLRHRDEIDNTSRLNMNYSGEEPSFLDRYR